MKNKIQIRQYIREQKRSRSAEVLLAESVQIMRRVEAHERFRAAKVVLAYYALPDEPATQLKLDEWSKEKRIILPVVQGEDLILREYTGRDSLKEGAFHIMEPIGDVFRAYSTIDLVIVPGMAFDAYNNRLGRGKGYYDRLLSHSSFADVYKLGVCFSFQKVESLPAEALDIPMDEVL